MGFDDRLHVLLLGEVVPFVGIFAVIVEFFGAIEIGDVAVVFGAYGVVAFAEGGNGDIGPVGIGVFHQRDKGVAFLTTILGKTG